MKRAPLPRAPVRRASIQRPSAAPVLVALGLGASSLAACDMTMFQQPKYRTQAPAPLFPDNTASQLPPEGTVAAGALADQQASIAPPLATPALLARGRERFQIYCKPCHGVGGDGDGTIVARGFPHPPSYASPQVMNLTGAQIFGVITDGYGVMFPYGDRVAPADRWAIVAYIRALQLAHEMGQPVTPPPPGSSGGRR